MTTIFPLDGVPRATQAIGLPGAGARWIAFIEARLSLILGPFTLVRVGSATGQ